MATELGKAYVQIMPSAKGITGKIQSAIGGEVDNAGTSAGNKIVSTIKAAVVAAGIGKLIASSISEGSKLQQSLGGIETLFKNNADKVKQYANEAYKTTGLSANAYMENVTGFSASLLQSLGGNTAKAADISNMAMIDMADNSNKMGTSMELIQNAYQGFAKQNYTMLDNLKLGYGGTKQEMERLLSDAQKLTGVKYDINNLSDVYQAIHAIQQNLDITGTTAKEAASTFSGSFNAMKASAQNVLGNLSLGEDIKPSLSQLVSTTKTFLVDNLWPMIKNVVSGIAGIVADELPNLISALNDLLGQGLASIFGDNPAIIDTVKSAIVGLITAFAAFKTITFIVGIIDSIRNAVLLFNAALAANPIGAVIIAITALAAALIYFFTQTDTGRAIVSAALDFIKSAWDSLVGFFTSLWETITSVISVGWTLISETLTSIVTPIVDGIKILWEGVSTFFSGLWETIKSIFLGALLIIIDLVTLDFEKLKEDVMLIWNSIKDGASQIWEGIKTVFTTIIQEILTYVTTIFNNMLNTLSAIWNSIKSVAVNVWETLKNEVINIVNNLVSGAKQAWENLKSSVIETVNAVKNFFSRLADINLFEAGKAIIQGFLNGLKSVWENVKSFVGGIADWIRNNKGPISYDRKLLIPAGKGIMDGLHKGLSENFENVKSTVSGMAEEINNQFNDDIISPAINTTITSDLSLNKANQNEDLEKQNIIYSLSEIEKLLSSILDKDNNTYLDGDLLAKNSYDKQLKMIKREGI